MTTQSNTNLPPGFEDALLTLGLSLSRETPQESPSKPLHEPYKFYCPTPETHARVLHRLAREQKGDQRSLKINDEETIVNNKLALRAKNTIDVFGWSLPIDPADVSSLTEDEHLKSQLSTDSESPLFAMTQDPQGDGTLLLPRVRFSNLYLPRITPYSQERNSHRSRILYAHSAFPTHSADSVFFGPDTYRFVTFLHDSLKVIQAPADDGKWKLAVDVGTGAGAGALALAGLDLSEGQVAWNTASDEESFLIDRVLGTDINPLALRFASVNSQLYYRITALADDDKVIKSQPQSWQARLTFRLGSLLDDLRESERASLDLVISNPPYIAFSSGDGDGDEDEAKGATYADGGKQHGLALPLLILHQAIDALVTGGVALLYTGVPVSLSGANPLWDDCQQLVKQGKARMEYWRVLDADVFGDELESEAGPYGRSDVGRIEVVGVGLRKL